eukprot:Protomagalhaensia_sp_Gyna_25__3936@NODE_353_length_3762_cov_303_129734_g272_i0_p2_GENE_NODE_353_length_3762_cov_303_129734_g272_i0NODE_353_length_3762_cov_303_129734_g272_i0_p2_ORF_typecomplete_len238_score29_71SUR7/PF06687_12/0_023_NODE_353_length_3762_cov_303_129734_g272_i029843697
MMFEEGIHVYELTPEDRRKTSLLGLAIAWQGMTAAGTMMYSSAIKWAAGHYVTGILGLFLELCLGALLVSLGAAADRATPIWRERSFGCLQGFLLSFLFVTQALELNWWIAMSMAIRNGNQTTDSEDFWWKGTLGSKNPQNTLFPLAISCAVTSGLAATLIAGYGFCLFNVMRVHQRYELRPPHLPSVMYMEVPADLLVQARPPSAPYVSANDSERTAAHSNAATQQTTPTPGLRSS